MNLGRLLVRVTIGSFFVGHGMQKLNGSFGGGGLEATAQSFESLGMRPGRRHAMLAGAAETGGGALIAAGLATPFAAAALTGVMTTAVRKIHFANGPWSFNGGYEYNAVLVATLAALVESGPGDLSLDAALGTRLEGTGWALAAIGAGILGSFANELLPGGDAAPVEDAAPAGDEPAA